MSAVTDAAARPGTDDVTPASTASGSGMIGRTGATLGLAACLVAVTFTGGAVDQNIATPGPTWTEIALTILGIAAITTGLIRRGPGGPRFGWATAGLMVATLALQAASISWSVAPDASWIGASQTLAYTAVFVGAIALARPLAGRWAVLVGALVLWAVALCGWSLLVKVFPATLASGNQIGRLQAPFGYWNAIALCAAMGLPGCLWLGARRGAGRRLAACAVPALTLLLSVLVLSYSRSADLAAVVALGLWLAVVPLRLRAVAVLLPAAVGAAVISVWMLAHHALSHNNVPPGAQDAAGHTFGIVIVVVLILVLVAGIAVTEAMDRASLAPETRRRAGNLMLVALTLGVLAVIGALATSSRGLFGQLSHGFHELTNPNATVSAVSASRVFQFGSSRPLYWHQALFVGDRFPLHGAGELGYSTARLLDPTSVEPVFQAHSYVFQTYADLGALGLLVTAALLVAWLRATSRTLAVGRRWSSLEPSLGDERIGLITLALLVVAFGVQGALDWTWFFTGLTVPALLAAGALAGRGPLVVDRPGPAAVTTGPRPSSAAVPGPLARPGLLAGLTVLVLVGLLGCWMVWRPLRSIQLVNDAENTGSLAAARGAVSDEPYSLLPRQALSSLDMNERPPQTGAALAQLRAATREEPDNPYAWEALALLELQLKDGHAAAADALRERALNNTANQLANNNNGVAATAQQMMGTR